jgi:hypothetical protein
MSANVARVPDANPEDAYLHATLKRIDEIANEDVEMQASDLLAPSSTSPSVFASGTRVTGTQSAGGRHKHSFGPL